MKRMLINATQAEELRVAIVDGQSLYDIDIEQPTQDLKKSNIYKGRIVRLEPSLEAAFVEYAPGSRHGFLPLKEISKDYFQPGTDHHKNSLKELLREGQEVVVQVDKEERGSKGAALTTFISLAGRYMVLMPNSPSTGGVSRQIEGEDRAELKRALDALDIPGGMGVIIRTAGVGRDAEELQWDLDYLTGVWKAIAEAALSKPAPFLIYQESRLITRALRDYMRPDISEILIDTPEMYAQAREFVEQVMPHNLKKLKHYTDDVPLFNRYQIESQIEAAYERTVRLPSGGVLVIDQTEALTAIDINSARATRGGDIEETAFNTNLEAAEEIARQLRLRDLGGLVVIDFIDMNANKHQREVEQRLQNALKPDRARIQLGRISKFGLLEMSRQRLRASLGESSQVICPHCLGHGRMRSVESLSLSIIRVAEEHAMKERTGQVLIQAPVEIANYLLNEKRSALADIEKRHSAPLVIVADEHLSTPHYEVTRLRESELGEESNRPSYQRGTPRKLPTIALTKGQVNVPPEAVVTKVQPVRPAPVRETKPASAPGTASLPAPNMGGEGGVIGWIKRIFGAADETPVPAPVPRQGGRRPAADVREGRNGRRNQPRREQREPRREDAAVREHVPREQAQAARQNGAAVKASSTSGEQKKSKSAQPPRKPRPVRQPTPVPPAEAPTVAAAAIVGQAGNTMSVPPAPQQAIALPMPSSAPVVATTGKGGAGPVGQGEDSEHPPALLPEITTTPQVAVPPESSASSAVSPEETVVQPSSEAGAHDGAADEGESNGTATRRRRGRRGGRRRRRGADAAPAAVEAGLGDGESDWPVDEGAHSVNPQPEFDFDTLPVDSLVGHHADRPVQPAVAWEPPLSPQGDAPITGTPWASEGRAEAVAEETR